MFTPTIKSIDKRDGIIRLIVEFVNGAETVQEEFRLTSTTNLKDTLRTKAQQLDALYVATINVGEFDISADPSPSQAELDKRTFFSDYSKWQQVKKLIDHGILIGTEPKVIALKGKVIDEFKYEYFNL